MNNYIYILVMALTTFAIRVIPLTVFRKKIKSRFLQSFLYYVPYVTLAVMTFPAIMDTTSNWIYGLSAAVIGVILAFTGTSLTIVSLGAALTVFILQFLF